jgi:hypothetical protein
MVSISWQIADAPSSGLTDLIFPFSLPGTPSQTGFYFAQQYGFTGQSDIGYTGLQPQSDGQLRALFSSFISGTTTSDPNCSSGADGGAGVSCAVLVDSSYSDTYNIWVWNSSGDEWIGTLVDESTGVQTQIGSWTLPADSGLLSGSQVGFVEYFPWNSETNTCSTLPKTDVVFGTPSTHQSGAGSGSLEAPSQYGDCEGKINFSYSVTSAGTKISVGF